MVFSFRKNSSHKLRVEKYKKTPITLKRLEQNLRDNRENISLQTLLLLFNVPTTGKKIPFVSTANDTLVGTLMTIGDVNDSFPIPG